MIAGVVNDRLEAVVELSVSGPAGQPLEIEAVVDTGFTGFLTLPPTVVAEMELPEVGDSIFILADGSITTLLAHGAFVLWDGQMRLIQVDASGSIPLVGMALLAGHNLNIDVQPGGSVLINSDQVA
ncbi:MAG: hypothetical protein OXD37_09805 [Acidimicrobiaceae bacterium]|nr:hypothetical protein [Acidimicrobiaceae bacterium]